VLADINACDKAPCTVGVVAVDNCSDLAPPQEALGNAPGRVCTCPPGYFYTEAQGCQGELANIALRCRKPRSPPKWLLETLLQ